MENIHMKCRCCLKEDQDMNLLFLKCDQTTSFIKILEDVLGFAVVNEEGYSNKLCRSCSQLLVDITKFKARFKQATKYFKNILKNKPQNTHNQDNINKDCVFKTKENIQHTVNLQDTGNNSCEAARRLNTYSNYGNKSISSLVCTKVGANCNSKRQLRKRENLLHRKPGEKKAEKQRSSKEHCDPSLVSSSLKKSTESDDSLKSCKVCKQQFSSDELDIHFETHKTHVCNICGHRFIRKTDLNDHEEIHLNTFKYVCQHCGKAFKVRTALNKHRRIHTHPREEICEVCGQRFNARDTLKTHYKLKHIESKDFQCNLCGLAFTLKSSLAKHIERHNPNRRRVFSCYLCDASYVNKYTLSRHHIIKHTPFENKPSCEFCGKRYTKKVDLAKHIKKNHIHILDQQNIKIEKVKRAIEEIS